jgi:hypothetical protein
VDFLCEAARAKAEEKARIKVEQEARVKAEESARAKGFRKLGFIHYNGGIEVHSSLLNLVLHEEPHIET